MTRVAIVDDHAIVRRGLKHILETDPGIELTGEAASVSQARELIRAGLFDVLVVDISLPDGGGLELLEEVRRRSGKLPVLVLSTYPEEIYAVRALKAGAAGYLSKDSAPDELLRAIHKVRDGGRYVSPALAERLATDLGPTSTSLPHERLTPRELQVLLGIASGKRVSEIASALHLSVKTISTYRARVLEKLGLESNAALTRYAIGNGLTH